MAEELRLNIVSTADSKGFEKAAKDVADAKAEAKGLSDEWAKAGDNAEKLEQSTSDATKSIKTHSEQTRILRQEYEKTQKEIARLNEQLLGSGGGDKDKELQKALRQQRTMLQEVRRQARELKVDLLGGNDGPSPITGVLEDLLGGIPNLGGVSPQLLAGGAVIGAALAPGLAAALAGAVVGTAGAGGIVGGALLAARNPQVEAAFGQLKDTFLRSMEPAGGAFVQPVLNSISILEDELEKGRLAAAIGAAAPLTEKFTKGIAGFVNEASDGLKTAFDQSGPLFDMWEKELPETGEAVADFFRSISADAPGAASALKQVFDVIQMGTRSLGDTIGGLTALNHLLQFPGGTEIMKVIPLGGLAESIGKIVRGPEIESAGQAMAGFTIKTKENAAALMDDAIAVEALRRKTQDLAIAQLDATVKARDLRAAWDELHGAAMSLDEAYKRAYDGLDQVTQAFQGSDDSIKGFSQGAVERRTALQEEATKAIAVAQAYYDMTGDAAGAQKKLDDLKNSTVAATKTTGEAKKAVQGLADELFRLPEKRSIFVTIYQRTVVGDFRSGERESSGRPVSAGIDTRVEGRAGGGSVRPNVPYMINERARETVTFPAGGTVHPANLTPMGGYAAPLVLNFPAGSYEAALIETISTAVQARGGRLAVLGLKAA
jgi:hypothetical protein